ncbi:prolyl-tRNA synthetase associated domain-containing protein [Thalassospira sp. ER-Se-21-Dark]|uniref:prolyl-tRNA synthetase associated domain-containing protein n=1 Tax=Thalassospira sp. ER-Se-21-Dark TaxID=2585190 RepID=UPI000795D1A1|nr:prolyl-tRNA synthetase associated domain-containing protein [Thalassospira sp. ER-Se-21-Dark]KXJ51283.1 MAG: DNA-binding protein [Thalassospira sp. Nap_22]MBP3125268.1 prolyl-tRNA synthetase associated domain-containing protein [Thalassospira sp. ER-Se-21-Dark]
MSDPSTPLFDHLAKLGIETKTHEHEPLFTVEDSQALRGDLPGLHSKNLFVKDKKGALWLVVAEEETEIRMNHLHKRLGCARLSFGKPELLIETLGIKPGSVTPFALLNDRDRKVNLALDAKLANGDLLNFHPLRNDRTTTISSADLLTFIGSLGYEAMIIDFDAEPAAADDK